MIYRGLCGMCVHRNDHEGDTPDAPSTCAAFPEGIPLEIEANGFDHRTEYEGDNGIRFAPDGPVSVDRIEGILAAARHAEERFG